MCHMSFLPSAVCSFYLQTDATFVMLWHLESMAWTRDPLVSAGQHDIGAMEALS